jgi:hypothetical protein
MDPQREDQPRISVVTLQHWQRVRADYTNVLVAQLDARLAAAGMAQDRKLYLPHMNQVGVHGYLSHLHASSLHLEQYIDTVFQSAKPNLRVNGRNFEDLDGKDEGNVPAVYFKT